MSVAQKSVSTQVKIKDNEVYNHIKLLLYIEL